MRVWSEEQWRRAARRHESRVAPWLTGRLQRRASGARHPVDDFLWEYYRLRPARLQQWHPGVGHVLAGSPPVAGAPGYVELAPGWTAVPDLTAAVRARLARSVRVMRATAARPARTGCFGMHEWAMVMGLSPAQVRHPQVPLRLSPQEIGEVIDSVGLRCTHFDAYRFFTDAARTRQLPLTRDGQVDNEQPGCVHAGMDLYRYAYEGLPFVSSDLVADCFAHAREARELDMAASPYDLAEWGVVAIEMETPEGRRHYVRRQEELAAVAQQLRHRVVASLDNVLGATSATSAPRGFEAAESDPNPALGRFTTVGD